MALNPTAITALTERADHLIRRQRISLDDPMGSDSLECPYQDLNFAEMLERNGWSNPDTDPDLGVRPRSIDNVDDCLEAIGVSKAGQWGTKAPERLNQFVSIMNEKPFLKDGERRSPPMAWFKNIFNPEEGLIASYNNRSPKYGFPGSRSPVTSPSSLPTTTVNGRTMVEHGALLPDVCHWSQICFAVWKRVSAQYGIPLAAPRNILKMNVLNDATLVIVDYICRRGGPYGDRSRRDGDLMFPPRWPGLRFGMGCEEGKLLLGSPSGVGVAHLLFEHKKAFGRKWVDQVTIFSGTDDKLYVLFRVVDVSLEP